MNECVLVVDDDREIVRAIAVLLEKEGYQVLKAYDGLQALELAVEKPVQLIIMDVMMPRYLPWYGIYRGEPRCIKV